MELEVQRFLREPIGTLGVDRLDLLEAEYSIKSTRHGRYPNLVLLKYSQIESPMGEKIVQECRGLILDEAADWKVVAMPYTKFFNAGESLASPIDWSTARIWEKLDGSIITLYHYQNDWHVSTSGVPDATCQVQDHGIAFAELFWKTLFHQLVGKITHLAAGWFSKLDPDFCYMFELCTPENRVVVRQPVGRVALHGVRNLVTLQEADPLDFAGRLGIPVPQRYDLGTLEACLETVKTLAPLEHEGFVVCDAAFRRLKIKSPGYLVLHHAKDVVTSRRQIALLLRDGEADEFRTALDSFPELRPTFEELETRYRTYVREASKTYVEHFNDDFDCGPAAQKEFALGAVKTPYASVLFQLRKDQVYPWHNVEGHVQAFLEMLSESAYLRVMGLKNKENCTMQRTLAVVKPGAVRRFMLAEILGEIESGAPGLRIMEMSRIVMDRTMAETFYAEHRGKSFFESLIEHAVSGPCYALVLEGYDAVQRWRDLIGGTDPQKDVDCRTDLRVAYGMALPDNALHGSDSEASAKREISLLFPHLADVVTVDDILSKVASLKPWDSETVRLVLTPEQEAAGWGRSDLQLRWKKLHPDAVAPERKSAGAAGYDLTSVEYVTLHPGQVVKVRTGLAVAIPPGYEGQCRTRSGLGAKGIQVINSPGTVDEDYRGEMFVMLINHGQHDYDIKKGDRIAQLVISAYEAPEVVEVEDLDQTARGTGGFGSTGR